MSEPAEPTDPIGSLHVRRYLLLVDVLRAECVVEPSFRPSDPAAWLAWAHGVRWLLHLAYEARAQAIAAGNLTLPPLTAFVTLRELVHYIDSIFRSSLSHRGAVSYPGIAWSPDEVRSNAQRDEAGTPPPLPLYTEEAFWTPPRITEERTDEALERLELVARQFSDTLDRMRPYPRAFEDLEHSICVAAHALGGRGGRREGGPSRARTPVEEDFRYHRETIYRPPHHRSFSDVGGEGPDAPIDLSTVD